MTLIQDLHAAISRRDWHAVEVAANRLRDTDLEADNAALTARVKVQGQEISDQSGLIADQLKMIEELEAKLAAAHELVERGQDLVSEKYARWHQDARAVLR